MKGIWTARILIGLVLFFNVQCAVLFIVNPQTFAPAYELIGIPGQFAIRGFGLLFIMWNIPYGLALINPLKFFISLVETVLMQAIGAFGESILFLSLPPGYLTLQTSMLRFIVFDTGGLAALIIALWITKTRITKVFSI